MVYANISHIGFTTVVAFVAVLVILLLWPLDLETIPVYKSGDY